jgi:tetratricopeptide (TPR) repeat protein
LARPTDQHLTQDELEFLVLSGASQEQVLPSPGMDAEGMSSHIAQCEKCRSLAANYASIENRLISLKSGDIALRGEHCPPDEEWFSVAAGLLPAEQAEKDMQHATTCDHCAPLLGIAIEDFSNELTPEEESLVNGLSSSDSKWQKSFAKQLSVAAQTRTTEANAATQWWKIFASRPRLIYATVGLLLVGAVLGWFFIPQPPQRTERLLAKAYTQQRTLELRVPGAQYAPLRVERASNASQFKKAPALLEADVLIVQNLSKHPTDPFWLAAKARANILDGDYEGAISSLRQVLAATPDSFSARIDYASALYERAEAEDHPVDFSTSYQYLSEVLAKTPDDPIALFNRAIVGERIYLYQSAQEDWEHYLRIAPAGEWAAEAKRRLDDLRGKLRSHEDSVQQPLVSPEDLSRIAQAHDSHIQSRIEDRVEEYLDKATVSWLPAAFPESLSLSRSVVRANLEATRLLSEMLLRNHKDPWLCDLLSGMASAEFRIAIADLSQAVKANASGDPVKSLRYSRDAGIEFKAAKNDPGVFRASLERVYSLQRSAQARDCLSEARLLSPRVSSYHYHWIELQLQLRESACSAMIGDLTRASRLLSQAEVSGRESRYGSSLLTRAGYSAALSGDLGDQSKSWSANLAGLRVYWQGTYPAIRAFNFYDELDGQAEDSSEWLLAMACAREAANVIDHSDNLAGRAMAHYQLARMALMANAVEDAKREFGRAESIFSQLPQTTATRLYRLDGEVSLIALQTEHKDLHKSLRELRDIEPYLKDVENYPIALRFYRTLGKIYESEQDHAQAETYLLSAARVADWGLASIQNERDRLTWSRETGDVYRDLVKLKLRSRNDPEGAFQIWEWYKAAALPFAKDSVRTTRTTPGIKNGLPWARSAIDLTFQDEAVPPLSGSHRTLISYALFSDGLAIWIKDDHGLSSEWVPVDAAYLRNLVRSFHDLCADPRSDFFRLKETGRRLYSLVFAPVSSRYPLERTIVIEPDVALDDLPWDALVDSSGHYLAESFVVSLSPGLRFSKHLNPPFEWSTDLHAVFVAAPAIKPTLGRDLKPLSDAMSEAEEAASLFHAPVLLTGNSATLNSVQQELAWANLFQFSGHSAPSV